MSSFTVWAAIESQAWQAGQRARSPGRAISDY